MYTDDDGNRVGGSIIDAGGSIGKGQGTTTREFENPDGKRYAGGGSAHNCGSIDTSAKDGAGHRSSSEHDGLPNTGGGGGGARYPDERGKGGSGIVIVRYPLPTMISLRGYDDSYIETYSGHDYRVYAIKDTDKDHITVERPGYVDVFLVGGGGGGGRSGGGGGYTKTIHAVHLARGTIRVQVGKGGEPALGGRNVQAEDGEPTVFDEYRARGGGGGSNIGGHGGSGGGRHSSGSGCNTNVWWGVRGTFGGRDGGNGAGGGSHSNPLGEGNMYTGGEGQGTTTRAFEEEDGKEFAGGGASDGCGRGIGEAWGGGGGNSMDSLAGEPNTGGGGAGKRRLSDRRGNNGGSGIILLRHRIG